MHPASPHIRLGLMVPRMGVASMYSAAVHQAAKIAIDQVNAEGGVLDVPLELVVADDAVTPAAAVSAAQSLLERHSCVALIGNILANSRRAVLETVAAPNRRPLLNFAPSEGGLASRYYFSFASLPNQQIEPLIDHLGAAGGAKVYFAGPNLEWPRGCIDAAKDALANVGGQIMGEIYVDRPSDPRQIDELLDCLARSGAEVFMPLFVGAQQVAVLARFSQRGLGRRIGVATPQFDEAIAGDLTPAARDGILTAGSYFSSLPTPRNQQLVAQWASIGGTIGQPVLTQFAEAAYTCVRAISAAIEATASTDGEALAEALATVEVMGPQGQVTMNPATHNATLGCHIAIGRADGAVEVIRSLGRVPPRISARYLSVFASTTWHATTPQESATPSGPATPPDAVTLLERADVPILATDAIGHIAVANAAAHKLFGYLPGELVGLSLSVLVPPHLRDRHDAYFQRFLAGSATELRMSRREAISGYRKDGAYFPMEASIAKLPDGESWVAMATIRDLGSQRQADAALQRAATHDALTGLPNRNLLTDRIQRSLDRARKSGQVVALLFIDLDNFKTVNDTYGHAAGDELLAITSSRLLDSTRPGDTVARLAGDEFVVLADQLPDSASVGRIATDLLAAISQPARLAGYTVATSASIGVSVSSGRSISAEQFLEEADSAMYAVKSASRGHWRYFDSRLADLAQRRREIDALLGTALQRDEFQCHFQPIQRHADGQVVSGEVLLRWNGEIPGLAPHDFIPLAEASGAILPIGAWVFAQACGAESRWRARWGDQAPGIAVNVSARQLTPAGISGFTQTLAESGAQADRITIELSEAGFSDAAAEGGLPLRALADLGLRVAIDNFGLGHTSMDALTRSPLNAIKIDGSVVRAAREAPGAMALLAATGAVGTSLGIKSVGAGIETPAERALVNKSGFDYEQGFLLSRPLNEADFITYVDRALATAKR